jgi:hypothetical protein
MPSLRLVTDAEGRPTDAVLDYSKDFVTTMLEWDMLGAQ